MLFVYHRANGTAYLLLYVDNIGLTASSTKLLQDIISSLSQEFGMTDSGELHYFLGIAIKRNSSGLFLNQHNYAADILHRANMKNCKPSTTPADSRAKLAANDGPAVEDPTLYRSLVGALQYLTFTRPDISFAVQQVCLFMHDPREPHLNALKHILSKRYTQLWSAALSIRYFRVNRIHRCRLGRLPNNKAFHFRLLHFSR